MQNDQFTVVRWIWGEAPLLARAQQIIEADRRDSTALFPWWVEFMLFGSPYGGFNLNGEPEHDGSTAFRVKSEIDRDGFHRIDWDEMRELVTARPCQCEHESHMDGGHGHRYLASPAGPRRAQHVGLVCEVCADGHMRPYLKTGA